MTAFGAGRKAEWLVPLTRARWHMDFLPQVHHIDCSCPFRELRTRLPQPYPAHLLPNLTVDTNVVLQNRPEHAAYGMAAIAQHSMAESMVSNVLTAMLRADTAPAAAIYGTIRNGKLQRDALMAVASEELADADRQLFSKVLGLLQSSAKGRDQLAHFLWAVDPQLPEALLLVRPDQMWRFSAQERQLNSRGGPTIVEAKGMQQSIRSACTVWSLSDVVNVRERGFRSFAGLIAFSEVLKAADEASVRQHRETIASLLAQVSGES